MIGEILVLLAGGTAAGLAGWFRGTIGCEIRKTNPILYENLKSDPEKTIDAQIEAAERDKKTNEEQRDKTQGGIDSTENNAIKPGTSEYTAALQTIQNAKKEIAKHEAKIKQMNTIKENGLNAFDWRGQNIAGTAGIFLGVGLLLHLIIKKVMKIFHNKE